MLLKGVSEVLCVVVCPRKVRTASVCFAKISKIFPFRVFRCYAHLVRKPLIFLLGSRRLITVLQKVRLACLFFGYSSLSLYTYYIYTLAI